MASKQVLIFTPRSNVEGTPTNQRSADGLRVLLAQVRDSGYATKIGALSMEKDVHAQVRELMATVWLGGNPGKCMTWTGDGSAAPILQALAREMIPDEQNPRVWVGAGGSVNVLAKALGSEDVTSAQSFLRGAGHVRLLRPRRMVVHQGGRDLLNRPFFNFASSGLDAEWLGEYEPLPRNNGTIRNIAKATFKIAPRVVLSRKGYLSCTALANRHWGPFMHLGTEHDRLDDANFGMVEFHANTGIDAALKFAALQLVTRPEVAQALSMSSQYPRLDRLAVLRLLRTLKDGMTPCPVNNGHAVREFVPSTPVMHCQVDGTPFSLNVVPDEKVSVRFSTEAERKVSVFSV